MDLLPMSTGDAWMEEYGWALLVVVGLYTFSLYVWSYLSRSFEVWKAKEPGYLDTGTKSFLERVAKAAILISLAMSTLYVASLIWDVVEEEVWRPYATLMFDLLLILVVVFLGRLVVRVFRRMARLSRIRATAEGMQPTTAEYFSLALSYIVYLVTVLVVLVIIVSLLGFDLAESSAEFFEDNGRELGGTLAIVVAAYFADRLMETVLEDYRYRTKRFTPNAIDLFKTTVRATVSVTVVLAVSVALLSMLGLTAAGVILASAILVLVSLGAILSRPAAENIISGLALMDSSIFDLGDKVQLTGLECEVIGKDLMFTKVRTVEGEIVNVPNRRILEHPIYNYTKYGTHGISLVFEASFSIPHGDVERYVMEAAARVENVLKDPSPELYARDIVEGRIIYEAVVYAADALNDFRIRSELILGIQEMFRASDRTIL